MSNFAEALTLRKFQHILKSCKDVFTYLYDKHIKILLRGKSPLKSGICLWFSETEHGEFLIVQSVSKRGTQFEMTISSHFLLYYEEYHPDQPNKIITYLATK